MLVVCSRCRGELDLCAGFVDWKLSRLTGLGTQYEHTKRLSKFNSQRICNGRRHRPSTADLVSPSRYGR
jgi:hypothetical protein